MRDFVIYKVTNLINGKIYVGKQKHYTLNYLGSGKRIKDAIKHYGKKGFKKEILEYTSEDNFEKAEMRWISHYNCIHPNGYNLTKGGEGGDTFTYKSDEAKIETRKRCSESAKKKVLAKIGITGKSEKGRHITESVPEIKEKWIENFYKKVREVSRRRKRGEFTLNEIRGREKQLEYWRSPRTRALRSANAKGTNNSKWAGFIHIIFPNGDILQYNTASEAAEDWNSTASAILSKARSNTPFVSRRSKLYNCYVKVAK